MFNNEDILMGSPKKPIMFNIVYATQKPPDYKPSLTVVYTDPTTGQTVTHSIQCGDSYSFPCAIGDTVKFTTFTTESYSRESYYRAPELIDKFYFFNGVDVSPTSGYAFITIRPIPTSSCTFTIIGESPFLNYELEMA